MFNKILEKERKILEKTYDLTATITRMGSKSKVNGETKRKSETVIENEKCAIGRDSKSRENQTESSNDIQYTEILFISPDVEIKQGDIIIVTFKNGDKVKYSAGVPNWFDSHQEVILLREDRA